MNFLRDIDLFGSLPLGLSVRLSSMGVRITHILETHLHADFISSHTDLAERTRAKIYAPKAGKCQFEHVALRNWHFLRILSEAGERFSEPGQIRRTHMAQGIESESLGRHHPRFHRNHGPALLDRKIRTLNREILGK